MKAPALNLVVLRVADIEASAAFYGRLGLQFIRHAHGTGPQHYASDAGGVTFELYPRSPAQPACTSTRIGFSVQDVDAVVAVLCDVLGARILAPVADSQWGRRAVVIDPDGHHVELVTPVGLG